MPVLSFLWQCGLLPFAVVQFSKIDIYLNGGDIERLHGKKEGMGDWREAY
jgi:hypothetical protein